MKKMIFALIALVVALPMVAQERVNREKARWVDEGEKVTTITGWAYDDVAGKWVECANLIEPKASNKKYANSPSWMAHSYNNIISLQFRRLEYEGDTIPVIVRERWEGEFKYPHIMKDWSHWKVTDFLVLTRTELEQLGNLSSTPIHINLVTAKQGKYEEDELDVDLIRKQIENEYPWKTAISIYKATDGHIRFVFQSSSYHERLKRMMVDIEKNYFEMTEEEFNSIFRLL